MGEVLSPDNVEKDVIRNVELYWQAPTIREYWIVDGLAGYRRGRRQWKIIEVASGATYTTKLLPGFEWVLDPRK